MLLFTHTHGRLHRDKRVYLVDRVYRNDWRGWSLIFQKMYAIDVYIFWCCYGCKRKTGSDLCLQFTTLINREAMQLSCSPWIIYIDVSSCEKVCGGGNGDIKIADANRRWNRKYACPLPRLANEFQRVVPLRLFSFPFAFQAFDPI